jgi:hypothetical protein
MVLFDSGIQIGSDSIRAVTMDAQNELLRRSIRVETRVGIRLKKLVGDRCVTRGPTLADANEAAVFWSGATRRVFSVLVGEGCVRWRGVKGRVRVGSLIPLRAHIINESNESPISLDDTIILLSCDVCAPVT